MSSHWKKMFTQEEMQALVEVMKDDPEKHHQDYLERHQRKSFCRWAQRVVNSGKDFRHFINKGYGKSHRKRIREVIALPLDEMPLLINDSDGAVVSFVKWRMRIGK